jgi:hypothetical protein
MAQEAGLTIHIVSIKGDECNLDMLCKLAEMTGGNVERVSPTDLKSNVADLLSKPVIASNVVAKVRIHKGLEFRNENYINVGEDRSLLVR